MHRAHQCAYSLKVTAIKKCCDKKKIMFSEMGGGGEGGVISLQFRTVIDDSDSYVLFLVLPYGSRGSNIHLAKAAPGYGRPS